MSSNASYYVWGRVTAEDASLRLTHQHFLITQLLGWLLHPGITAHWHSQQHFETPRRIADVACGNGVWATELAASRNVGEPVEVVGFDINDALFPRSENQRPDTKFAVWDAFKSPPKEDEGTFDVVNLRLLFGGIPNGDPRPILRNILKLLKPGGSLQWLEYDFDNPIIDPGSAWSRLPELFAQGRAGHSNQWVVELDNICREEGMEGMEMTTLLPHNEMLKFWQDNWYVSVRELVRGMKNSKVDEIWETLDKEKDSLGYCPGKVPVISVTGRKPASKDM